MHLASLEWSVGPGAYGGHDVHLLRGELDSVDLSGQLFLNFALDPGDTPPADPDDLSIRLSELSTKPALQNLVVGGGTGNVFDAVFPVQAAHGFTISPSTGAISIPQTPPSPQVYNFILRATLTPVTPPPPPPPATAPPAPAPVTASLRFHFHDAIAPNGVVLSPQSLTIPANGQPQQFGVLVHFTDDVVGDVSTDAGISWALFTKDASGTLTPVPSNKTATVTLNQDTGQINASGPSTDSLVVQATVRLNGLNSAPVTASAPLIVSGDVNAPLAVRFIDGAGVDAVSQVPNLLILSDGYQASEQPLFDALVDELVQRIRYSPSSAPFSDFIRHKSLNIFAGFVPSTESGCSVLYELMSPARPDLAEDVAQASDPEGDIPSTLSELIFGVGFPIPSDATATPAAIEARWNTLFPTFVSQIGDPALQALITQWQTLANRTLAIARDTALGVSVGVRPNENDVGSASSVIVLDGLRTKPLDVQNLASTATVTEAGTTTPIGAVWGAAPLAKDRNLIAVLANGAPNCGTNQMFGDLDRRVAAFGVGYLVTPVGITSFAGDSRIVALDPDPTDSTVHDATLGAFLHEMAHSLECGDEYGHRVVTAAKAANALPRTKAFGNIVLDSSIRDGATNTLELSNTLWGALTRIRAAGALAASPFAVGANYRITLQAGQRAQFDAAGIQVNEPLYLRLRPLMAGLAAIQNQPAQPPNYSLLQSPKLRFVSNDTSSPDAILVKLDGGGTLASTWNVPVVMSPFPQVPILLAPTLGSSGQELSLISPPMRATIEAAPGQATNRAAGVSCQAPDLLTPTTPVVSARVPPVNIPPAVKAANIRDLSKVVGLYDGAVNIACQIYHPTGYCRMRNATDLERLDKKLWNANYRTGGIVSFCHVCAYILVDYVDPTLHATIDGRYAALYME